MEGRIPYITEHGYFGTFTRENGQYGVYYIGQIQVFLPQDGEEAPRATAHGLFYLVTHNPRLVIEFLDGHEADYDPDDFEEEFDAILELPEVPNDTRLTEEEVTDIIIGAAKELWDEKMQGMEVM